MKNAIKINLVLLTIFFLSSISYAKNNPANNTILNKQLVEKNLLMGLNSENQGLQLSSAYFLGEVKSQNAVIPLMSLLHSGKTEEIRIMAALSLYKINSPKAIYAVQQAAKFDSSERVRRMCLNFHREYLSQTAFQKLMGRNLEEAYSALRNPVDLLNESF